MEPAVHAPLNTFVLPAALLAALVTSLSGQDPVRPAAGTQPPAPAQATRPPPASPQPVEPVLSLATKLIGAEIVDAANAPLARVADLVIEPAGGIVVIADRKGGGLVGVPLELVPLRVGVEAANAKRPAKGPAPAEPPPIEVLQLLADPQLLVSAEVIAKDAVKSLDQPALDGVRRHLAGQPPLSPESVPADVRSDAKADASRPLCFAQARGQSVKAPSGASLGEFKDVAIDIPGGRVAYVIVSSGGVLGLGATAHGVPPGGLTRGTDGGFLLNTDRKTLDDSPGIDLDRLPSRPSLQITAKALLTDGPQAHGTQR